jgi:hypothetical protein
MKKMFIRLVFITLLVCVVCVSPILARTDINGVTYGTKLVSDKSVYAPGDIITYKLWVDFVSTDPAITDIDHFSSADFTIDPNVESISQNLRENFNGYCQITGNLVQCRHYAAMLFWFMGNNSHQYLIDYYPSDPYFTITGKIKSSTQPGTTITSTASTYVILSRNGEGWDTATNQVTIESGSVVPSPEFPSAFLPAMMIIGLIGSVLYIKRTREH